MRLRRKKKETEFEKHEHIFRAAEEHEITKTDFPIVAPVRTSNFGDVLRYFKFNMGSGLLMATLERMVNDARQDLEGNQFGTAVKFISMGIMLFMVFLGAYILVSSPAISAPAAPAIASFQG